MTRFIRNIFSLAINLTIVGILIYVMILYLGPVVPGEIHGGESFKYYTTLSNLVCAIACLLTVPYNILTIIKKENRIPKWINIARLFTITTVGVTFFVVLLFLGPFNDQGFAFMYSGSMLYLHLIVPVLAMVSFICFDLYIEIDKKYLFYNLIPTIIYAIFYIIYVIGYKKDDFYMFFKFGPWAAIGILFAILALAFGLGALLRYLNKLRNR